MATILQFALKVERLARRGVPVEVIVRRLASTEEDVREAMRMLDVPEPDSRSTARAPLPPADERAAIAERVPQKWRRPYDRESER